MFYEYAVEPQAIAASWANFRYIIEKFGFDQGRLIAEFPKRWLREVYDATISLPPVQRKRVEEALNQARKNKLIRTGRPYNESVGDWLQNAVVEHQRVPFRAIIANANPTNNRVVLAAAELDESHPLMNVPHDQAVHRDAKSLAAAMKEILEFSSRVVFIDPFFDPFDSRYRATFRECLDIVRSFNPNAVCEIHYRYHNAKPANDAIEREAPHLFPGTFPNDLRVIIFCWREKAGGEDFHDRYLLTERGGIAVGAGFSAEGAHQTTDMRLMSYELSQEKLKAFARGTTCYELVEPVIRVAGNGQVERI
ncbi:hypothetical protein [Bradyrhizobium sp. SZCCHNRI3043]|uniref:hypothetical protein n=1 Tax=Bradyrhizobium sp. SZCCHNRI3043 TaxID=3057292 RepID=UPI0028EB5ABC|nr:hypothetical protein [Bradyrhizobium sp. SZCCHNRI3043]